MKPGNRASGVRRIIGDVLLALAVLLTADVVIVMLHKINTVVLKTDYQKVFRYELILCAVLLVFALDVRFNLFTRSKRMILRIVGWIVRAVVLLFTLVIVFFGGKVAVGSLINTAGRTMPSCSDWRWKTESRRGTCWRDWTRPRPIWRSIRKRS